MKDPEFPYMVQFCDTEGRLIAESGIDDFQGTIQVPARSREEAVGKALLGLGKISDDIDKGEICPLYTKVEKVEFTLTEDDSKYQIKLEERVQKETDSE